MNKEYVIVVNERNDPTIAELVQKLFTTQGSRISLQIFEEHLKNELKFKSSPLKPISLLGSVPIGLFEQQYRGDAYRVLDNLVYQTDPINA